MSSGDIDGLARVVGANFKRLRESAGVTQDVLAKYARECGLRWNAGKVAQFERGLHNPAFSTVLAASQALTSATGSPVGPADLVFGDAMIAITDKSAPRGDVLADIIRGDRSWDDDDLAASHRDSRVWEEPVQLITRQSGVHEARLAKRLGCSVTKLAELSDRLWGRSFSDQRDAEAGPDANAQKRGRVSRRLQSELEKAMADGND